jgi:transcription termination factor Rho
VFPAIDLLKSGTRREELLLSEDEINGEYQVRKMLGSRQQEMYEQLIDLMSKTASNAEFFSRLKGWLAVYEKEGYSLGK